MALEYVNRKGQSHYLKSAITKNGKERYYIVKDIAKFNPNELVLDLPRGYEFYEMPDEAQVVIRKILVSNITIEDLEAVDYVMRNHKTAKDYLLDKDKNGITVYLGHLVLEDCDDDVAQLKHYQSYNFELRFEKVNKVYKAQRFCSISRYYGWITMETNEDLAYLAKKYCFHINKESLLKFWIEGEEDW